MDELFEILTLKQTKKIPNVPIILVGKEYWQPLVDNFIKKILLDKFGTISKKDLNLFKILDDEEEILQIIRKAKMRNEYTDLI